MKKKIASIISILSFLLILSLTSAVMAQEESTDSGQINDEEISKSIKERIKKVATKAGSLIIEKRKIALIGSVEKIANDTLTIKTKDEIKLASVSATTVFVRSPGNTNQKLEDVSINDYAIAMGFINGSDVLETKRVLLYSKAPEKTKKTSIAGVISYIDEDEDAVSIISNQEEIVLELTSSTDLSIQQGTQVNEIDLSNLELGQYVTTIYIPTNDEYSTPKALTILASTIKKDIETIQSEQASESAKIEEESIPPELAL
ncbi:hypothetical protein ACFL1M_00330 [Patescibacteria group bacterium]